MEGGRGGSAGKSSLKFPDPVCLLPQQFLCVPLAVSRGDGHMRVT